MAGRHGNGSSSKTHSRLSTPKIYQVFHPFRKHTVLISQIDFPATDSGRLATLATVRGRRQARANKHDLLR
jgi:hypothetical protein